MHTRYLRSCDQLLLPTARGACHAPGGPLAAARAWLAALGAALDRQHREFVIARDLADLGADQRRDLGIDRRRA